MEDRQCISFSYPLGILNITSFDIDDGRHEFITLLSGPISISGQFTIGNALWGCGDAYTHPTNQKEFRVTCVAE